MAGNELPQGAPVDPVADPHGAAPHTAAEERAQWRALQGDVEGLADVAAERGRGLLDGPVAETLEAALRFDMHDAFTLGGDAVIELRRPHTQRKDN